MSEPLTEAAALALHLYIASTPDGELLAEATARRLPFEARNPKQAARLDAADARLALLFEDCLRQCHD